VKRTQSAYRIAQEHGLSAIDALHIAAAIATGAEEFITTEKPGKPIYRVSSINVIALQGVGATNGTE
jgi:predicted nucleic acid-binding protein